MLNRLHSSFINTTWRVTKLPRLHLDLVQCHVVDWQLTAYGRVCAGVLMPNTVVVSIDSCAPVLLVIIKLWSSNCATLECQINVLLHISIL